MESKRIAVIAGDGIGKEVMPEGLRVLAVARGRTAAGQPAPPPDGAWQAGLAEARR